MVGSDEISSLQTFTMDTTSLCQDCGKLFTEKWMLQEHKRVAHDERVLKCDHCSKEVHKMCIADVFDENYEILINEFKCKFYKLYEDFKLPMTLKIHVIVDHYGDYFKETGIFLKLTNGEHHEAIHHTIKVFEAKKNFLMTKNLESLIHQAKCLQSIQHSMSGGQATPHQRP